MQINITNGTLTQVQETLSPSTGYVLPSSITVSGASYTYDSSTGVISLSNPTGNVTITASGIKVKTFDLSTLQLSAGTHQVKVKARATGYRDSEFSNSVNYQVAASGYSGNITTFIYFSKRPYPAETAIKFDTAPTSDNDYDAYVDAHGVFTGITSYTNKTKIYVWSPVGVGSAVSINNNVSYSGSAIYNNPEVITLTDNYDIKLGYKTGGQGPL